MGGLIVQVCRAKSDEKLQGLIGASKKWLEDRGYTKINASYESESPASFSVYLMDDTTDTPRKIDAKAGDNFAAVLVMTKP